jgi:hypothetical protein
MAQAGIDGMRHTIEFKASGRGKAQCPPNPDFPHGIALDATTSGGPNCTVRLPYPAPECGMWVIHCKECPTSVAVTAVGRVDDPISIKMECSAQADGTPPVPR